MKKVLLVLFIGLCSLILSPTGLSAQVACSTDQITSVNLLPEPNRYNTGSLTVDGVRCFRVAAHGGYAQLYVRMQLTGVAELHYTPDVLQDFESFGTYNRPAFLMFLMPGGPFDTKDVMLAVVPTNSVTYSLELFTPPVGTPDVTNLAATSCNQGDPGCSGLPPTPDPFGMADGCILGENVGDPSCAGVSPASTVAQLVSLPAQGDQLMIPVRLYCPGNFEIKMTRIREQTDALLYFAPAGQAPPTANVRDDRGVSWDRNKHWLTLTRDLTQDTLRQSGTLWFAYVTNPNTNRPVNGYVYITYPDDCSPAIRDDLRQIGDGGVFTAEDSGQEVVAQPPTPVTQPGSGLRATVANTNRLNVRSGAGVEYGVVRQLENGDEVVIVERTWASDGEPWARLDSTQPEWVNANFLDIRGSFSDLPTNAPGEWQPARAPIGVRGAANTDMRLRGGPGTEYRQLDNPSVLPEGEEVDIVGQARGFYLINYGQGAAWVAASFIVLSQGSASQIPEVSVDN